MTQEVYQKLQKRLDTYSMGFPATESGIEFKILEHLFTPEEAEIFLALSPKLEAVEPVAARLGQDPADLGPKLTDMAERGLLFRSLKGGVSRFGTVAFVHGLFEFQLHDLKPELVAMVEQYHDEGFEGAMQTGAEFFLRTIPVGRSVDVTRNVAAFEDAVEILNSKDSIVVADCICRKKEQVLGRGCGKPLESCFIFGAMGQYYLDRGIGRQVSLDEAVKILDDCREAGMVTQPATSQNPSGMCNCCGDCCGVLKAIKTHPKPATIVFSNWRAQVNPDECTECEICLTRCQVAAIAMSEAGPAQIDPDRCIGCGLCVTHCPGEAIALLPRQEGGLRLPPANGLEQMMAMAKKRGIM